MFYLTYPCCHALSSPLRLIFKYFWSQHLFARFRLSLRDAHTFFSFCSDISARFRLSPWEIQTSTMQGWVLHEVIIPVRFRFACLPYEVQSSSMTCSGPYFLLLWFRLSSCKVPTPFTWALSSYVWGSDFLHVRFRPSPYGVQSFSMWGSDLFHMLFRFESS